MRGTTLAHALIRWRACAMAFGAGSRERAAHPGCALHVDGAEPVRRGASACANRGEGREGGRGAVLADCGLAGNGMGGEGTLRSYFSPISYAHAIVLSNQLIRRRRHFQA
eukprot:6191290-Pleurochrysis_carterae.AAC.1